MTRAQRTHPSAGDALLRPFRFEGLEVGSAAPPVSPATAAGAPCDVLVALDFDGAAEEALGLRLAAAAERLRGGGVLLLGLSNRFGLRFWSGSPEPGSGTLFTTLAGPGALPASLPPSPAGAASTGRFASRHELAAALGGAGFEVLEWFFAAPDPTASGSSGSLISERLLAADPGLAAELITGRPSADRLFPRLDLFPEALIARELARAGLLSELADHFLVAAAPRSAGKAIWTRLRPPAPEIGWHYAASRRRPVVTLFELGESGIAVSKRRLEAGATEEESGDFFWVAQPKTALAPGVPLRLRLEEHLVAGRREPFLSGLDALFAVVRARFARSGELAGEALDALATNATLDEHGTVHLFDLEWQARATVPVSWWILRNVLACVGMRGAPIADLPTGAALYETLCARVGVEPRLAADLQREADLGVAVRSSPPERATRELAAALARPWPTPVALGLGTEAVKPGAELAAAHRKLVADYRGLEAWVREMQAAQAAAQADYRRLEAWAKELEEKLPRADSGFRP